MTSGKEVTFEQIESFGKTYSEARNSEEFGRDFRKSIENDADNYDFFIEKGKDKLKASLPGWITLVGAAVIFIIMVITGAPLTSNLFAFAIVAIIYFLYVINIKKRSVNGNEEYHMWKAFKKFLAVAFCTSGGTTLKSSTVFEITGSLSYQRLQTFGRASS